MKKQDQINNDEVYKFIMQKLLMLYSHFTTRFDVKKEVYKIKKQFNSRLFEIEDINAGLYRRIAQVEQQLDYIIFELKKLRKK